MVTTMDGVFVRFPDEPEPGDVVELYLDDDGAMAAQVRIPAPRQEEPC